MLVGTVTRDPELRYTPKGAPVCNFRIAVNERYKDASGQWKDAPPSFIPIVVWGPAAERCGERLKKGHHIHVEGKLKSRDWETREGQKRSTLEVVGFRVQFLSRLEGQTEEKGGAEGIDSTVSTPPQGLQDAPAAEAPEEVAEEIPF